MKEFFEHLKALIDAHGGFGNVRMQNDIPDKIRRGEHRPEKKRSVYIGFSVEEVMNKCLGINQFDLIVKFIVANDNKKFSKTEDMALLDDLNGVIQNASGGVDDVFNFSPMTRLSFQYDEDHDQVSESATEYKTKLTDYSGYRRKGFKEGTFTKVIVEPQIVESL